MRVEGDWITGASSQEVCALLENGGHAALFVGGCVRNALLGVSVGDIDISTDARPDRVIALAAAAGLRAVPTGIAHGTVTVLHSDTPFEITTFRRDVETDGRHAVVAFANTLEEDAERRDFTMNALYADRQGTVRDPVGGLSDLAARHFRFIGDPEARIREDYLRILRFFRFHAWYGRDLDEDGLAACAALSAGLKGLSAERVTAELIKLLSAPDPLTAVAAMERAGVLHRVLPGASARVLGPYLHLDPLATTPDPMARLAALGGDASGLRLSRAQRKACEIYRSFTESTQSAGAFGYAHGARIAQRGLSLRAAALEQPLPMSETIEAEKGANAVFPVRASDLPGGLEGPAIGAALRMMEQQWIASDFTLTKAKLLALL